MGRVDGRFADWGDESTLTVFDPPRPVWVNMLLATPFLGRLGGSPSLRVRASGARVEPQMPGSQAAWVQFFDGQYVAVVDVPVRSANGLNGVVMTLWLPAHMVRLRSDPD